MTDKTYCIGKNRQIIPCVEGRESYSFGWIILIDESKSIIKSIVEINVAKNGPVFPDLVFKAPRERGEGEENKK